MVVNLFVGFAHHHRLNGRQEFSDNERREPQGRTKLQRRAHIPAKNRAATHSTGDTHLSAEALYEIPDLPALNCV